ncbi:MAG: DUF1361 domain-containing protein [Chitinophagaceae bacterium]
MMLIRSVRKLSRPGIISIEEWLLLSVCFSGLLLLSRIIVTGLITYLFLPWNLLLGFIPYFITHRMTKKVALLENRFSFYGLLGLWLLFIPNSFYIITDLFHLTHIDSAPKWYDLLMVFSFAWNGLLFGILSLRKVEFLVSLHTGRKVSVLFVAGVMWLCALGIYIGRFLRFNSWDILTNPFSLAADISDMVIHPLKHGYAWGMTVIYGLFMTVFYLTIRKIGESFPVRD